MLTNCFLSCAISLAVLGADTETLLVHDDYEQWEWRPIEFAQRREGRKRMKEGRPLSFEYRGPLFRVAKGFLLPTGRMLEGADAFKGRSTQLEDIQVGLHGRYSALIRPGMNYRYEVALKGKGDFHFRAWVGAKNTSTGDFRWLGFPNLIKLQVTEEWQVYRGTFQAPVLKSPGFQLPEKVSAAIVVEPGARICVDEFRVWEIKPAK
jgi:hypothetical protein